MIVNAGVRFGGGPLRYLGGATGGAIERMKWGESGALRNIYAGEATVISGASIANKSAFPSGYLPPTTWAMAQKAGGMTSRGRINGAGNIADSNLAGGLNAEATLSGSGTISQADLGLIVSAVASLTGSGGLTASVVGVLNAAASLVGSGDLAGAMRAVGSFSATLTGSGSVAAVPYATGSMAAAITVTGTGLTTANVADAVWNATAESTLTYADIHRILLAVSAGQSVIIDLGGGAATVSFRDVADTKDRVTATMANSERTAIVLDGE